ncbi:ABC transporter permease [Auritidibacter sp. NML100628]|uniref:ABC transporter permease n=1 Tax=Auritidibacter sp. NML100628 TaxID=2170742 RepID=UPI000D73C44F|nr:ABC transporter permease [Auritidibacter sp. NML100628]PXA76892.1 ABC transporter permease [Auritidibacter sp. NML100628]
MLGYLTLELRRALRASGTLLFTLVFPAVFYALESLLFSDSGSAVEPRQIMIGMSVWGTVTAGLLVGTRIVDERATGWQRVLRLTPLSGHGYLTTKVIVGVFVGLPAVIVVPVVAVLLDGVALTPRDWAFATVGVWLGSIPFAVLGVTIGLFAQKENVQTIVIVLMLALATLGGLFLPLNLLPEAWTSVAQLMPSYWLAELGLAGTDPVRAVPAIIILTAWFGVLALISLWRYRHVAERI